MQSCCRRLFFSGPRARPSNKIKTQKLPRPAMMSTAGNRSYHWIFNAYDGSLLLPHYFDSNLLPSAVYHYI
jgi:hypothetical protein